jgi:hypothetical protein
MPTGPPDPSPPVEADFRPSHDAITAEPLDLTWQLPTHAAPTVRAEPGQFLTDHGQHPVAGLGGPGVFDDVHVRRRITHRAHQPPPARTSPGTICRPGPPALRSRATQGALGGSGQADARHGGG